MVADEEQASPPSAIENIEMDSGQPQTSASEQKELSHISEGFREELVEVLKTEMQAMAGKLCRDSCREFRRFVDTTAARSRRLERKNEEFKDLLLGSPADGDTFTGFMQRHRLHNARAFAGQWKSKDGTTTSGVQAEKLQFFGEALRTTAAEEEVVAEVLDDKKPMVTNGNGSDIIQARAITHAHALQAALSAPEPPLPGTPEIPAPEDEPPATFEKNEEEAEYASTARLSYVSFMDAGFGTGQDNNGADDDDDDFETADFETQKPHARRGALKFTQRDGDKDDEDENNKEVKWNDPVYLGRQFAKFIKGDIFDYIMGSVLALNAIFMGAQVEVLTGSTPDQGLLHIFDIIDWVFACLFLSEVILRIAVTGKQFFFDKFNVADIAIVCLHFTELIVKQVAQGQSDGGMVDQLGMLRMLRLGRLARMVRMVRLIPELKSMVYLMSASMASFFWAVVLMIVVMYAFSIYFTEICIDIRNDRPQDAAEIGDKWGSIWTSMLTLYMAISGGDDWNVLLLPLTYTQPEFALLNQAIFSTYIAFSTLVMLNLVTGVFVEGAQRIIKEEQDNEVLRMASKAFLQADADMSCEITWNEFNGILNSQQMTDYCNAVGITLPEAYDLFDILDIDKSQSLSVDEFVKGCLKLRGQCTRMDVAQFRHKVDLSITTLKAEVEGITGLLRKHIQNVERRMSMQGRASPARGSVSQTAPENVAEEV